MPKLDATSEHTPPPLHKIFLCFLVRWERSVHILYAIRLDGIYTVIVQLSQVLLLFFPPNYCSV